MCDLVTDIRYEKQAILIVINESITFRLDRSQYLERPLTVGEKIDVDEYGEWLQLRQYPCAMNDAIGFLAVRARSVLEVRQKLVSKGYTEHIIDMVICRLEKEGLVDDEKFAFEWSRSRIRRQYGNTRILWELKRKGICDEMAAKSLKEASTDIKGDDDDIAITVSLAKKLLQRVHNEPNSNKAIRKVLSAMIRRGYSYEDASAAIQVSLTMKQNDEDQ